MRSVPALLALILLAAPTYAAPREGIIKADVADVRCQPSDKAEFYVTNRLTRGSKVEIIEEVPGGWLKIKPPPGSFSWIKTAFLEEITPNQPTRVVAIRGQEVPVMVGTDVRMADAPKERPNVVGTKLKFGEQVVPFANEVKAADGVWMRIQPPPSEVRYVKASALEATASFRPAAGTTVAAAPKGPLPPASTPSANPVMTPEQLWAEALRLEQGRRYDEAIQVWDNIAGRTVQSHPQASSLASQRARYLRDYLDSRTRSGFTQARATSTFQAADNRPVTYRGRVVQTRGAGLPPYSLEVVNSYGMFQHAFYVTGAGGVNLEPFARSGGVVEVSGTREQRNMAEHLLVTRITMASGGG